jgi:hypothetical protein
MSITTAVCDTFTRELVNSTIGHFTADTYKLALIKPSSAGALGQATTNYSDLGTDEVASGAGYTTGGVTLTGTTASGSGRLSLDWNDATWATATFSAAGWLIYNSSKSNRAVAVGSFGGTYTGGGGTFTVPLTNPVQTT